MIIYGLLLAIIIVLDLISDLLGKIIPSYPDVILSLLDTLQNMISGGLNFVSYFTFWEVVVALLSLIIAFHTFKTSKDFIMKVFGHFLGN